MLTLRFCCRATPRAMLLIAAPSPRAIIAADDDMPQHAAYAAAMLHDIAVSLLMMRRCHAFFRAADACFDACHLPD